MPNDNIYIGRTNYLNDLFSGIFRGAGAVVDQIQAGNRNQDMLDEFDKFTSKAQLESQEISQQMKAIYGLAPTPGVDQQQMGIGDVASGQRQGIAPEINPNVRSREDVYSDFQKKGLQWLSEYGENAKPFVSALGGMYENYFPKMEAPKRDVREGRDGDFWDLTDPDNPRKIVTAPPKVEKKEYTPNEVYSMTIDDILAMPKGNDFIDKNFEAFSPETKAALQEKYPYLIPDPEKTGGYKKRGGHGGSPRTPSPHVKDTIEELKALAQGDPNSQEYADAKGRIASEFQIYGADELDELIKNSYYGDPKEVEKQLKGYRESIETFDQSISDFHLQDLSDDLYAVETNPEINSNGVADLYKMIDDGRIWVNNYIKEKGLNNAQSNQVLQLFNDLEDRVLRSKFLK